MSTHFFPTQIPLSLPAIEALFLTPATLDPLPAHPEQFLQHLCTLQQVAIWADNGLLAYLSNYFTLRLHSLGVTRYGHLTSFKHPVSHEEAHTLSMLQLPTFCATWLPSPEETLLINKILSTISSRLPE